MACLRVSHNTSSWDCQPGRLFNAFIKDFDLVFFGFWQNVRCVNAFFMYGIEEKILFYYDSGWIRERR